MGLFSFLFNKKKKGKTIVVDEADEQSKFLKSDEEMKAENKTKSAASVKLKASTTPEKQPSESNAKKGVPTKKAPSDKILRVKDEDDAIKFEETVAVNDGRSTKNGKFDIRRAKDGRFFFCLYASNHMPIAYSQLYSTIGAATNGIESIIVNSPKAQIEDTTLKTPTAFPFPKWEIYIDRAGEYRFRLYAINGNCICHASHGYSTKSGCKGGMESITRFAKEAKVDKSYLK